MLLVETSGDVDQSPLQRRNRDAGPFRHVLGGERLRLMEANPVRPSVPGHSRDLNPPTGASNGPEMSSGYIGEHGAWSTSEYCGHPFTAEPYTPMPKREDALVQG